MLKDTQSRHRSTVKQLWPALAIAACGLLISCSQDSNPSAGTGQNTAASAAAYRNVLIDYWQYVMGADDTIYVIAPARVDTARSCNGSSMIVTPVDVAEEIDTALYRLRDNDTLWLSNKDLTASTQAFLQVLPFYVFRRMGSGTGLIGQWQYETIAYEDPDSTLNMIARAYVDSMIIGITYNWGDSLAEYVYEISGSHIHYYRMWNFAEEFLTDWDTTKADYDITADSIGGCVVVMTGAVTGETATVTGDDKMNISYSSSLSHHGTHTFYDSNPLACPNTERPEWWQTFLDENRE